MTMREEFEEWMEANWRKLQVMTARNGSEFLWQAAYRAGQEEMRERAAKVADEYEGGMEPGESIRLLTIDEGNK